MTVKVGTKTAVRYGPVILWALLILTVSSIPNLSAPGTQFRFIDKIAHIIEYGIFGYLLTSAWIPPAKMYSRKRIVIVVTIGILYGILDEIYQSCIPGRESDPFDVLADAIGVCAAIVLWIVLSRKRVSISH